MKKTITDYDLNGKRVIIRVDFNVPIKEGVIKDDNRIENLRWCTNKDNSNNRKTYAGRELIYIDEINENAIEVEYYGEHRFENYYFYDNFFYLYNGIQYKRITTLTDPYGLCYADLLDVDNKKVHVRFSKFKKLYNII